MFWPGSIMKAILVEMPRRKHYKIIAAFVKNRFHYVNNTNLNLLMNHFVGVNQYLLHVLAEIHVFTYTVTTHRVGGEILFWHFQPINLLLIELLLIQRADISSGDERFEAAFADRVATWQKRYLLRDDPTDATHSRCGEWCLKRCGSHVKSRREPTNTILERLRHFALVVERNKKFLSGTSWHSREW